MQIMPNNLRRQYELYADEYQKKALEVLDSGWYVLGNELIAFEQEWAEYIGVKHCVGLASGLDSLRIAFRLIGVSAGDEVIVCSNAYIACVMAITQNGGIPVFVEPDKYYCIDPDLLEKSITKRTKAILVVHLFGQCCNMDALIDIATRKGLRVIEDCAQSHGNHWKNQRAGSFGDIACFSFYPTKGCGAFGDGGCIVTNSYDYDYMARVIRNYGSEKRYHNVVIGENSRLDEIQAGLLRVKLSHLDELNAERERLASRYNAEISNSSIIKPAVRVGADSSWHQYVIRCKYRDRLANCLKEKGIGTLIHYPIPPHLSEAYSYLGYSQGDFPIAENYANQVLSLPIYNGMTQDEQSFVIDCVNDINLE